MVFSYDSRIRIIVPSIKMHESIVFNLVICEHTWLTILPAIIHYATFAKDSNLPNGRNGPLDLSRSLSISRQPYEGIGFISYHPEGQIEELWTIQNRVRVLI